MACSDPPTRQRAIDWQERREDIAARALPLYVARPWTTVSIDEIAEDLGIGYWQVYYSFDGQEDVYRASATRLIDDLAMRIADAPAARDSVNRTIQSYIRHAADIVGSEPYQQLLFLRLRDGPSDPWIRMAYENRIAEPLCKGLEDAVTHAGEQHDLKIVILHGICERFLTMLEAALALPKLLQYGDFVDQMFDRTIVTVTKEVFAATCTFDGFGRNSASMSAAAA